MKPSIPVNLSATKSGSPDYIPDYGDIIKTNFTPNAGSEQGGYRRALVLTARIYNERAQLCQAAPLTGKAKGYSFEVAMPAGCVSYGVILVDHTRSISWPVRGAEFVERAPDDVIEEARAKLQTLFQF